MKPERRAELERVADELAANWDEVKDLYRIHRVQWRFTLERDNANGTPPPPPRLRDEQRDTMPDFAAYRRAIVDLVAVDRANGKRDRALLKRAKETARFPVTAEENCVLWDALAGKLYPDAKAGRAQRINLRARSEKNQKLRREEQDDAAKRLRELMKSKGWRKPFAQRKLAETIARERALDPDNGKRSTKSESILKWLRAHT